ncbi:hypothetical protein BC939DRAFT_452180 [Gamsiella multidivaricata]|uniref:uncharacterized protein n=1 Tax=Gamsiella multidivaricata TaxID=101098 RepID=UPI00221F6133|nr:uncharacterized protein BC939DRAFT_452180 [Gamsiella multidivaricata]KAI7823226.1 hypothetical protein BC939DRAFT_452180 [Gamsiella multidivaricata]
MPLLIYAVPLSTDHLGIHYWKAPRLEDLPEELEYLPYQEFEDRFLQLNKIARPAYPTQWPNIATLCLLAGVIVAAVTGIMHKGTNLAVMGQGACFLLPVIIVIWVKVRTETNARSRRRFKHRSQKLLRAWTTQDAETHAIQWKLRRRSKSVARPWLRGGSSSNRHRTRNGIYNTEANAAQTLPPFAQLQTHGSNSRPAAAHEHERQHAEQDAGGSGDARSGRVDLDIEDNVLGSITAIESPSPTANVHSTLRINTRLRRVPTSSTVLYPTSPISTASDTVGLTVNELIESNSMNTYNNAAIPTPPPTRPSSPSLVPLTFESSSSREPRASIWTTIAHSFQSSFCCAHFFRDRKVWLIEISLRDCQLDEYALMVPSPVYCDYRLPGYEDAMRMMTDSETRARAALARTSSSRVDLHRYMGEPPAYESESDDDDDGDEEDEGDDRRMDADDDPEERTEELGPAEVVIVGSSSNDGGEDAGGGGSRVPENEREMTMVQRTEELSAIVVLGSIRPSTSSDLHGSEEDNEEEEEAVVEEAMSSTSTSLRLSRKELIGCKPCK